MVGYTPEQLLSTEGEKILSEFSLGNLQWISEKHERTASPAFLDLLSINFVPLSESSCPRDPTNVPEPWAFFSNLWIISVQLIRLLSCKPRPRNSCLSCRLSPPDATPEMNHQLSSNFIPYPWELLSCKCHSTTICRLVPSTPLTSDFYPSRSTNRFYLWELLGSLSADLGRFGWRNIG